MLDESPLSSDGKGLQDEDLGARLAKMRRSSTIEPMSRSAFKVAYETSSNSPTNSVESKRSSSSKSSEESKDPFREENSCEASGIDDEETRTQMRDLSGIIGDSSFLVERKEINPERRVDVPTSIIQ